MSDHKFSRRRLVQSVAGAGLFLPLLNARRGWAAPAFPKRLIIFQTTNGTVHDSFWPKSTDEKNFALDTPILKSLAPYKSDVIVMGGFELRNALEETVELSGGIGHKSLVHLLTGTVGAAGRLPDGRTAPCANSISIDQHIANGLKAKGAATPFKSLELGCLTSLAGPRGDNDGLISYNGPAIGKNPSRPNGNRPEEDPYALLTRLFGAGVMPGQASGVSDADLERARQERTSALDFVAGDLSRLQKTLGSDDKMRLQAHLDGIRQVEQELAGRGSLMGSACAPPMLGTKVDLKRAGSMPAIMKAQFDLLVAAMSCNLTQVATVMASNGSNEDLAMTWLGDGFDGPPAAVGNYKVRDHHNLTHAGQFRPQKIKAEAWFAEQFAYLIGKLKSVPEGSGTMLDNTVVWYCNNMDNGANHSVRGMPWILAGSCGGFFRTGRYVRFGDWGKTTFSSGSKYVPQNGLLATLATAMGVETETFGAAKYMVPLPGLV